MSRHSIGKYVGTFSFTCEGTDLECRGVMLGVGIAIKDGLERYDLEAPIKKWHLDCYHREDKECK